MMVMSAVCPGCGTRTEGVCDACWASVRPAPNGHGVTAAIAYEGAGRRLLLGLKYANARHVVGPLADRLVDLVDPTEVDVVTWAPTSGRRRRRRGYDQAELIARAVATRLDVPARALLRRTGPNMPQTGRSREARADGPMFVGRRLWRPVRVLALDDVVTTGATLRAASAALQRAGAGAVVCVAAAATPRYDEPLKGHKPGFSRGV